MLHLKGLSVYFFENICAVVTFEQSQASCFHGYTILSGYSVFGRPSLIPMKAALWHFPGLKILGSEAVHLLCFHIVQPIEQAH